MCWRASFGVQKGCLTLQQDQWLIFQAIPVVCCDSGSTIYTQFRLQSLGEDGIRFRDVIQRKLGLTNRRSYRRNFITCYSGPNEPAPGVNFSGLSPLSPFIWRQHLKFDEFGRHALIKQENMLFCRGSGLFASFAQNESFQLKIPVMLFSLGSRAWRNKILSNFLGSQTITTVHRLIYRALFSLCFCTWQNGNKNFCMKGGNQTKSPPGPNKKLRIWREKKEKRRKRQYLQNWSTAFCQFLVGRDFFEVVPFSWKFGNVVCWLLAFMVSLRCSSVCLSACLFVCPWTPNMISGLLQFWTTSLFTFFSPQSFFFTFCYFWMFHTIMNTFPILVKFFFHPQQWRFWFNFLYFWIVLTFTAVSFVNTKHCTSCFISAFREIVGDSMVSDETFGLSPPCTDAIHQPSTERLKSNPPQGYVNPTEYATPYWMFHPSDMPPQLNVPPLEHASPPVVHGGSEVQVLDLCGQISSLEIWDKASMTLSHYCGQKWNALKTEISTGSGKFCPRGTMKLGWDICVYVYFHFFSMWTKQKAFQHLCCWLFGTQSTSARCKWWVELCDFFDDAN